MKTSRLSIMILSIAVTAFAFGDSAERGRIEIVGHGSSSAAPEYAALTVTTLSICYDTAREAERANALLANKVLALLEHYRVSERDKVSASGGASFRETEYIDMGTTHRILCERKWKTSNQLTLKTSGMKSIPELQDALIAAIDQMDTPRPDQTAQTYGQLSQPSFHLYPETKARLTKDAEGMAWEDAKSQFDGFAAKCHFRSARLTSISLPVSKPIAHAKEYGDILAPIAPEEIEISTTWQFVWTYEPVGECFM